MVKLATNIVKKAGASKTLWSFLKVRFRGSPVRLRSSSDTLSAHKNKKVSFCSQMSPVYFLFASVVNHYREKREIKQILASDQIRDPKVTNFRDTQTFLNKEEKRRSHLGCTVRPPVIFRKNNCRGVGGRILSVSHTSS